MSGRMMETLFLRMVSVGLIALGGGVIVIAASHSAALLGSLTGIPIIIFGVVLAVMSTNQLGDGSGYDGFGLHVHRSRRPEDTESKS